MNFIRRWLLCLSCGSEYLFHGHDLTDAVCDSCGGGGWQPKEEDSE